MVQRLFLLLSVLLGLVCPSLAHALRDDTYRLNVSVKDHDDQALNGVTVKVRGPVTGQGPIAALLPAIGKTDGYGHAEFTMGLPGDYWVSCEKEGFETHSYKVTLKDKRNAFTLQIKLKAQDKGYPINVFVHDAHGQGINNAKVVVSRVNGEGPVGGRSLPTAYSSDVGRATVYVQMPTEYRVEVSHDFYGDAVQRVTISDKSGPTLDFQLASSRARIVVSVKDENGDAVEGATVLATPGGEHSQTTDSQGMAYIVLDSTDKAHIRVVVTHPDFDSKEGFVEADNSVNRDYSCPFVLTRKNGKKTVIVDLHEAGNNRPINGATVTLDGARGRGLYTGISNPDGHTVITVNEGDTFTVTVNHRGYKSITDQVVVKGYDDQTVYKLDLEMELADRGERDMRRMLLIKVRGKTNAGTYVVLVGATVTLQGYGYGVTTDMYGNAEILHKIAPGEVVSIVVEPKEAKWKKGAGSALIRANGTEFDKIDMEKAEARHARDTSAFKETNDLFLKYFQRTFGPQAVDTAMVVSEPAEPIGLTGDVIPNKGRAKIGETVNVQVALLYPGDPTLHHSMQLDERIDLFGPNGKLVTNNLGRRTITEGVYSRRYLNIVCSEAGTYTVKTHVTGAEVKEFDDSASFTILAGSGGSASTSGGVFKLVKRETGHAADPAEEPYGTWSGSVGESSFSASYEGKGTYDSHASLQANWSVPPSTIKPGDTIELTCTASGSVTGKDHGNVGISAGWGGSGNVSITGTRAFAGISESGKLYPSGEGKFSAKIGSSGSFTLYSSPAGIAWGSGGVWTPCIYTYQFEADAPVKPTTIPKKTTMTGG